MVKKASLYFLTLMLCTFSSFAGGKQAWAKPGKLILKENFDSSELPELFTVDWVIGVLWMERCTGVN